MTPWPSPQSKIATLIIAHSENKGAGFLDQAQELAELMGCAEQATAYSDAYIDFLTLTVLPSRLSILPGQTSPPGLPFIHRMVRQARERMCQEDQRLLQFERAYGSK
jgi:hypothetical protein